MSYVYFFLIWNKPIYNTLINTYKQSLNKRLLIPSVNTGDIITLYINTIKGFRIIDNTGELLKSILTYIDNYLNLVL